MGQNGSCVQREEWGSLRPGSALRMYQSPHEDLIKRTNMSSLSVPAQQHQLIPLHLAVWVPWPGRLKSQGSFNEAKLSLSHSSSQCLLFLELAELDQIEKSVLKLTYYSEMSSSPLVI